MIHCECGVGVEGIKILQCQMARMDWFTECGDEAGGIDTWEDTKVGVLVCKSS